MDAKIKPTFNGCVRILRSIIYLSIFPVYFMLYEILQKMFDVSGATAFILLSSAYLVIILGWYLYAKTRYLQSFYEIGHDVITHYQNFPIKNAKALKINHINEIAISQGPIQKLFGLGHIFLHIGAKYKSTTDVTALTLYDIANPQEIYDLIKTKMTRFNPETNS